MPKRSRSGVVSRPGARRCADQRERRQVERDDARPRPLADGDRQRAVLHRRIEGLLERAVQAVDLVDEEHAAGLERGEQRGDVALALERRTGGLHEARAQLLGHDLGQRRLAQPGRAGRAARGRAARRGPWPPRARRRAARGAVLADELLQPRAGAASGRGRPRPRRARPGVWMRARVTGARRLQRAGQQLLGAVAVGAPRAAPAASAGREAELEQPVARQPPRVVAARDGDRRLGRRRARRPSRAARRRSARPCACRPRRGLEPRDVAGGQRGGELARRAAAEDGERDLRPDRLDADEQQEQVALVLGGEAVERERVVAHDEVGEQRGRPPHGRDLAQRLGRHGER